MEKLNTVLKNMELVFPKLSQLYIFFSSVELQIKRVSLLSFIVCSIRFKQSNSKKSHHFDQVPVEISFHKLTQVLCQALRKHCYNRKLHFVLIIFQSTRLFN